MLELVDESLEAFFRAAVPLSATDIDLSFEAPDRDWAAKLSRPTVNLFLWDIRRSATRSRSGNKLVETSQGVVHRMAAPVLELRYVVTAWTSDQGDERALLAGLLRAILANGGIPREFLPPAYDEFEAPSLTIARAGEDHMDVMKLIEGQLKPGINMMLATEFDIGTDKLAGPPVEGVETAVGRIGGGPIDRRRRVAGEVTDPAAVGVVARAPADATYVNAAGRFLLRASEGDEIVVETDPPLVGHVPAHGGVRFG
ncbi:MAG TPA: Pvc16 family protein [Ilumatobacter sp.]|nr:Pvc16 family protein [Ilumatobacter sp.]